MLDNILLENINEKVGKVCCLGSDIVGNALVAQKEWLKYRKAITVVFYTHQANLLKKLSAEEKVQFYNYYNQGFLTPYLLFKGGEYLRAERTYLICR